MVGIRRLGEKISQGIDTAHRQTPPKRPPSSSPRYGKREPHTPTPNLSALELLLPTKADVLSMLIPQTSTNLPTQMRFFT